jgi:hypothetical protein
VLLPWMDLLVSLATNRFPAVAHIWVEHLRSRKN